MTRGAKEIYCRVQNPGPWWIFSVMAPVHALGVDQKSSKSPPNTSRPRQLIGL